MRSLASFLFAAVGSLAVASGCTSWKLAEPEAPPLAPLGAAPRASAKVCIVRTSVLAEAVTFPTHDNGALVGATRGPGHFCYLAEPGTHEIAIGADQVARASLWAEAGRSYFLKEEVDDAPGAVRCRPVWLDGTSVAQLIEETPYEVLAGVPGSESLPTGVPFAVAAQD